MYISFEELLNIQGMKAAEIVAGQGGLWRHITGAHVVELVKAGEWVESGQLLFVSGVGLKNINLELLEIVKAVSEKNIAGIVIESGPYIKTICEEVLEAANERNIPLITIPFEVPIGEIISQVYYLLYSDMGHEKVAEQFMKLALAEELSAEKANYYGFNQNASYLPLDIGIDASPPIISEQLKRHFVRGVKEAFAYEQPFFYFYEENEIIVLMTYISEEANKKQLISVHHTICKALEGDKKSVSIGVGTVSRGIENLKGCILKAQAAYKVLRKQKAQHTIYEYTHLGIEGILLEADKQRLEALVAEYLGRLLAYDQENKSELVETLKVYLASNCNIGITTEQLYVHRNTVKYRLKRIEEILGYSLNDVEGQFNLRFAVKAQGYIKEL